jgi:prevent-host-death family protein
MQAIGAFGARRSFGALLDRVARGEEIVISRRGKPVARLIAADGAGERERHAAAALRALAQEMEEPAPRRAGLALVSSEGRR